LGSIVVRWYLASLDQAIAVLGATDPTTLTWTFSSNGDQQAGWWCRRLAVEVAIHRWDIERASVGDGDPAPRLIDRVVAGAGIEEFIVGILSRLVTQEGGEGIGGTLCFPATDGPEDWWIDFDCGSQRARSTSRPTPPSGERGRTSCCG
jgi:Mycothiol maleylpyruvate isomerase N-terminal domain